METNEKISNSVERLKELLEIYGLTQREFCERTGLNKSVVSLYVNGRREPMQDNIATIAKTFNVDPAWIMGFDVPMKRKSLNEQLIEAKVKDSILDSIGNDERTYSLAVAILQLPDSDKDMIESLVSRLLTAQKPKQQNGKEN